jgi:glycosyltransferase involved in cell wall biosynthesis
MPPPVVTVLLPARSAERTVARAVESLLEGTPREIRVLAVDDGSTDGTRAVLEGLAARDALALSHATSPYVARMDADDEALPRRLEASVAALEADPGLGGVGTGVELFREDQPVSPSMRDSAAWLNGLTTPDEIRAALTALGWVEGMHFTCAA